MKLIVGLGNPGAAYAHTRHNVGFDIVEALVEARAGRWKRHWFVSARSARLDVGGSSVRVVEPLSFMNRSGKPVAWMQRRERVAPENILVVYDDIDLACGGVKIRGRGGAGGHNGMQSIIDALGTRDFPRLRVGAGPRPKGKDLVDFVLSPWPDAERPRVAKVRQMAVDAIEHMLNYSVAQAMNIYNTVNIDD